LTAFDRAWDVVKSQFVFDDETAMGTHYSKPWDYKYRVPIGYNPDGSLKYGPRDKRVRIGSEKGSHYPSSVVHLQNFEFPDSDDPKQKVSRSKRGKAIFPPVQPKTDFADYDPAHQDQRSMEDIISTIIHENIHDAYTQDGYQSILGGNLGEFSGQFPSRLRIPTHETMGSTADEEFPGKIGEVDKDAIRRGWYSTGGREQRPLPSSAKIIPGMGRKYATERLPNERSAYVGMYPNLRGYPRYRTIKHTQVPLKESDLIIDNIIAARKRAGAGTEGGLPERMRSIAREKRKWRGGRGERGFVRDIHEEPDYLIDPVSGKPLLDPETGEKIENPRRGLAMTYASEQDNFQGDKFAIQPVEQILNNLLNAINQSVYTRMANSGEFFEDESIPLQSGRWAGNSDEVMRPIEARQTLGGRSKAVANETQNIRRLLNAHFKKVRQGTEPLPTRMTDLPQNIQEEIGRIQLREMLGEERGRTGIIDMDGVINPLGQALQEAKEAISVPTRPENLNYIVAAEMNDKLISDLEKKLKKLVNEKLGISPEETGSERIGMRFWDKEREIKENDPEARALVERIKDIRRKTRSYPGHSSYSDFIRRKGKIPLDMSRSEWAEERKRLADAILAQTTGLAPAGSRSKKMGYDLEGYGSVDGSMDKVFANILKPELEARGYKFDTDEHPYDVDQEMMELFGGIFDPEGYSQYSEWGDQTHPRLMSRFGDSMIGVRGKVRPQNRPFGNLTDEVMAWFDKN